MVGTVEAFWSADQFAKDSGYVAAVRADIGDRVKKGQVLAVIDDPELHQQRASAQATLVVKQQLLKAADAATLQAQAVGEVARSQLAGLEAEARLAQVTLARQEKLFSEKAATNQQLDEVRAKAQVAAAAVEVGKSKIAAAQADLEATRANRAVAAAHVEVARAEVERLRTLLEYTNIVAPFDGIVTRRGVNPGDLVQAATATRSTALFTCQQTDTVRVSCAVPETSAAGVHVGDKAEVLLQGAGGRTFQGNVTRVAGAVQPQSRTMRAEIDLDNAHGALMPGMYTQVTLFPGSVPPEDRNASRHAR